MSNNSGLFNDGMDFLMKLTSTLLKYVGISAILVAGINTTMNFFVESRTEIAKLFYDHDVNILLAFLGLISVVVSGCLKRLEDRVDRLERNAHS